MFPLGSDVDTASFLAATSAAVLSLATAATAAFDWLLLLLLRRRSIPCWRRRRAACGVRRLRYATLLSATRGEHHRGSGGTY